MTEPTPDTPESELTGDGLRAARRVADVLVSEGLIAPDIFDYAIRDKDIATRLRSAALPNREAAPAEGADATADAVIAGLDRANVRLNREAAPDNARTVYRPGQVVGWVGPPNREAAPREGLDRPTLREALAAHMRDFRAEPESFDSEARVAENIADHYDRLGR